MDLDGKTLREAREYLELSQLEVAELLNVGLTTYQRWEQGRRKPRPYHRRKIRQVFEEAFHALGVLQEHEASSDPSQRDLEKDVAQLQGKSLPCPEEPEVQDYDASIAPIVLDAPLVLVVPDEAEAFIASHMTTHLWNLAHLPHPTCDDKRYHIREAIKEFDTMNATNKNYHITRREALCALATLPMITLGLTTSKGTIQPAQYGKALAHCTASLEACWELSKSKEAGDLTLAFECISKYLPVLETIARNSSQYRKEALDLAARCALVKTFLGWQCAGPKETIQYARDAVARSKDTGNISLQLSAYSKLAWAYFHDKQYMPALATAQEAEAHLDQYLRLPNTQPLHPCIQGGTYSTLALMQATNRQSPDVALGKATEADPGNESYAFMDFKQSNLLLETGWTYCYQGNQAKAMETLEKRVDPKTLSPKIPQSELGRIATINTMALSSLRAKDRDMEKTIYLWVAGIEGAKTLKSEQRFIDSVMTHEFMEIAWPGEQRIMNLRDLIVHW
ncbi:MAG: helix-turn-helix transcriptional regulator [Chloroflexi bacterium]|nr:helix-turn-helix transcriptional regulator [Chloroflexota bacterium]